MEITIVLTATLIICALGWHTRYVSCMVLLYYIGKKGYEFPSEDEIKECTGYVTKRIFGGR